MTLELEVVTAWRARNALLIVFESPARPITCDPLQSIDKHEKLDWK
jgi:hypothetical protein